MENAFLQKKKTLKSLKSDHDLTPIHPSTPHHSESSNPQIESFSSPKKSLKRKHPLVSIDDHDTDSIVSETQHKKPKHAPVANFITSSPKKKGRKSKLSTEKSHEQTPSLLLSTESKEEEHDEAPSAYSKIINTLFSPMLRAFTSSYKHQHNESEKKEKSITKNSSKHLLQSTETLNEMTDLETNEPSLIQPQPFISETQLEDFINEEEMLDDDEDDDFASFDSFAFIKSLPPYKMPPPNKRNVLPPKSPDTPNITLVLDLDETLVHCTLEPIPNCDLTFTVDFMNFEYSVYVRKRPFFDEFMNAVSKMFEIVIFTASQQVYADKLLSLLDPEKKLIRYRLFREHCINIAGNFLKDLNVLGRDLSKVAIIDNSPHVFGYQLDNGIPIETWFDDPTDRELLNLLPFLRILAHADDVRPLIRNKFKLYEKVRDAKALPLSEFVNFDLLESDSENELQTSTHQLETEDNFTSPQGQYSTNDGDIQNTNSESPVSKTTPSGHDTNFKNELTSPKRTSKKSTSLIKRASTISLTNTNLNETNEKDTDKKALRRSPRQRQKSQSKDLVPSKENTKLKTRRAKLKAKKKLTSLMSSPLLKKKQVRNKHNKQQSGRIKMKKITTKTK